MLQQAPLPSQHENPLKQVGFRALRSRPGFWFGRPVQPRNCPDRTRLRRLRRRPGMTEHQLHAHGKRAIWSAKRLVSRRRSVEGPSCRQPAPPCCEGARSAAATQNPAQTPEIRCMKANSLHVHDDIREADAHQRVPQYVHVGKWMHALQRCGARLRVREFLQRIGPERTQKHQAARTQDAQTLRDRSFDRVEPRHRQVRQYEIHGVGGEGLALCFPRDMEVSGEPARCARSRFMQQRANRVDGHDVGSAKPMRELASRGASARPEIEDPARPDANAVETIEQPIPGNLHDPGKLGLPVSGSRECAPHRNAIEYRAHRLQH